MAKLENMPGVKLPNHMIGKKTAYAGRPVIFHLTETPGLLAAEWLEEDSEPEYLSPAQERKAKDKEAQLIAIKFGQQMREARERAGLTLEVAAFLHDGLTPFELQSMEAGTRTFKGNLGSRKTVRLEDIYQRLTHVTHVAPIASEPEPLLESLPESLEEKRKYKLSRSTQVEDEEWDAFKPVWKKAHGNYSISVKKILALALVNDMLLTVRGDKNDSSQAIRIGVSIKRQIGRGIVRYKNEYVLS